MWKTAVMASFLALAARPVLAADSASSAAAATANLATGTVVLDKAGIQQLTERVVALEKRVDQLGVADPQPPPTQAELKRAKLFEAQHQEFLNQVWTAP